VSARKPRPQPVSRRIEIPRWEVPSDPTGWVVSFLLLVVLCVVLMAVAAAGLRQWRVNAPATPSIVVAGTQLPNVLPSPERAAARSLADTTEALEREAREKAQREAEERHEAARKARLAEEEAARRSLALEARRDREWAAYYRKPDICDQESDSVSCANDFIRQRRTFDEQFAARNRGG